LFVETFQRLTHKDTGFSSDHVLTITATAAQPQPLHIWVQAMQTLSQQPGVSSASLAGWPLLDGMNWANAVALPGGPPSQIFAHGLTISPGWVDTMRVRILEGRDLNWNDVKPDGALVNESFARAFFGGADPIGKTFTLPSPGGDPTVTVVGLVKDACYSDLRQCAVPTAYYTFDFADTPGHVPEGPRFATFIVKTEAENPLAVGQALREELERIAPELHVMRIRTQKEVNDAQTIHERLLSTLAMFFAVVAVLLAAVGLYGVLNYSVVRRRREIGIRIAVGAQPATIARAVIVHAFVMVLFGIVAGVAVGMVSLRPIESLFYEVRPTDASALAAPAIAILVAAVVAALPAVVRAVRIDPVILLRAE